MALKQTPNSLMAPDGSQYVVISDGAGNLVGTAGPSGGQAVEGTVASGATDSGNPVKVGAKYNTTQPTFTTGQRADLQVTNGGQLLTHVTGYVSAGADGIANTQMAWVGTDNAGGSSDSGTSTRNFMAEAPYLFNGTTWDRQRSIVGSSGTASVGTIASSASAVGMASNATSAANSSQVLKASSGNLYSFTCTAGASAGYLMVFNAISAPVDGAVTPIYVEAVAANATVTRAFDYPITCGTGITLVFSTTGPFTKTASATAFLAGQAI